VDKPCDATAVSFGFPIDVLRGDQDYFALFLFNSWFGEHRNSSSHLYQVIREKRGMNYGDYSYIEVFPNGGSLNFPEPNHARHKQIFEVWLRPVQHQNAHFALRAAIRELQLVVENGLTKEQFELTKNFLYNYILFYAQTTSQRLGYQLDSKFYGINDGGNYIDYFRKQLQNLTLDQVNKAIKKHIQFDNIKIAIVTNHAEQFMVDLINNTPSPVTYLTKMSNDILNEDKIILNYHLNILPENVKVIKVDNMFAN
jgi:zinc protease